MPVAHRSIEESSQLKTVDETILASSVKTHSLEPPKLDATIFEQIRDCLEKMKSCNEGSNKDQEKIAKLSKQIEAAEDIIAKAEQKRDALQRRNNFLRNKLEKWNERVAKSIEYWQEYGFDVKQLPKIEQDGEEADLYEFIYTKKDKDVELPQPITVVLKYLHHKKLQIVSWAPAEVLTSELQESLNSRLTASCCHSGDEHVDFKLAMLMIKQAFIKHPDL